MPTPDVTARIRINLDALAHDLFRELRAITHNVAAGLNASSTLSSESFKLPDTGISLHPIQNVPHDANVAKVEFARWIVANGLRGCIEATARYLEAVRQVLALWTLSARQSQGTALRGEDWNRSLHDEARAFHRLGLPHKLDDLHDRFGFSLDANADRQIRSINRLRNCLVHRKGCVTTLDVDSGGGLSVHWLRMAMYVADCDGDREVTLPAIVKAGGSAGVRSVPEIRTFRLGDVITLDVADFMKLSWTLFVFACVAAKNVEQCGRAMGVDFLPSADELRRETQLDEELAQTFPASDPLPWIHRID